jgi:hypothetical protein
MSDEVKATNFACCDDRCDDWLKNFRDGSFRS